MFNCDTYSGSVLLSADLSAVTRMMLSILFSNWKSPIICGKKTFHIDGKPVSKTARQLIGCSNATWSNRLREAFAAGFLTTVQEPGSACKYFLIAKQPTQTRMQAIESAIDHLNAVGGFGAYVQHLKKAHDDKSMHYMSVVERNYILDVMPQKGQARSIYTPIKLDIPQEFKNLTLTFQIVKLQSSKNAISLFRKQKVRVQKLNSPYKDLNKPSKQKEETSSSSRSEQQSKEPPRQQKAPQDDESPKVNPTPEVEPPTSEQPKVEPDGTKLIEEPKPTTDDSYDPMQDVQGLPVMWETLDQHIHARLMWVYGDSSFEHAQKFVKRCREFRVVAPCLSEPEAVLDYWKEKYTDFKERKKNGESFPKTARDFVKWCANQDSFEIFERTYGAPKTEATEALRRAREAAQQTKDDIEARRRQNELLAKLSPDVFDTFREELAKTPFGAKMGLVPKSDEGKIPNLNIPLPAYNDGGDE